MSNAWCDAAGISQPKLEDVRDHREARPYTLLLVALLEKGSAMTLEEVASRFHDAGTHDSAAAALASLKRCRPARPPLYREGDLYHLDPYDDELDLQLFILGLRPPMVPRLRVVRPPEPVQPADAPLCVAELDEAFRDANLSSWSAQRTAIAVLDAHGRAMAPAEVVAFVQSRTKWHKLEEDQPTFERRNSAVAVTEDGSWSVAPTHEPTRLAVRKAVRERITNARRSRALRSTPEEIQATRKAVERKRAAHAAELARLRWGLLYAYPAGKPSAVALLDVLARTINTFLDDELATLGPRIEELDAVGGIDVRAMLRALGIDLGARRLGELGPPQKSITLNRRGRALKITPELLIGGSCSISKPLGDEAKLDGYLRNGQHDRLRRRLESNVKSLHALYQYGRTHGAVRLRWGFLDEMFAAPWVHRDERTLYGLKQAALEAGVPLEIVSGSAPGWTDPWARARTVRVYTERGNYRTWLLDDDGLPVDERDVQLARLGGGLRDDPRDGGRW